MTTESLTYTERTAIADNVADAERIKTINAKWGELRELAVDLKANTIKAQNLIRSIGYELEGLAGGQLTMGFFNRIKPDLQLNWEQAQQVMAALRKHRDEITSIECAQSLIQTYQTAGLLELPEPRTNPQESHDSTPVTFVFHTLGSAWERIENKMRDLPKWDVATKASVRVEIERFERKAQEVKGRL